MSDTAMTIDEREAFLAGVHVAVLAVERDGRGPLAVPVWYQYDGTDVTISTEGSSVKATLLRRAGRATLTVQDEAPPYKYVSVEGPVTIDSGGGDVHAIATRYLGAELGAWYAEQNPPNEDWVTVRLRPERWLTVDYAKVIG